MASEDGEEGWTRPPLGAYVVLGLMVLIGSSTATAAKFAVRELPVGLLPIVRFGGAGLCLLPIVGPGPLGRLLRRDGGRLLMAAAFCVPINQWFFLSGTRLAPTSHVALIYGACPLVVLMLASALGQERLRLGRLAGVLASMAGVVVIALEGLTRRGPAGPGTLTGDLLLIGAVTSWGMYLTVNKPLVARHGALPTLAGTFLLGTLLDLPIVAATMPGWTPLSAASPVAWYGLIYLMLVVCVFGLAFQNLALRHFDASQVATVNNIGPILTVAWGVLLLNESTTPALAVGGLLTLGGSLWAGRPERRRPVPALAPVGGPRPEPCRPAAA